MQINITAKYHYTQVTMAKIEKTANDKCWWRVGLNLLEVNQVTIAEG